MYTESIPTDRGAQRVGTKSSGRPIRLPAKIQQRINREGGNEAGLLEKVVTSPAYGAPHQTIQMKREARPNHSAKQPESKVSIHKTAVVSAVVGTLTQGSDRAYRAVTGDGASRRRYSGRSCARTSFVLNHRRRLRGAGRPGGTPPPGDRREGARQELEETRDLDIDVT